ncbi:helix-turn-helix domain-containing protein [Salinarchaeum chitinilyticum]
MTVTTEFLISSPALPLVDFAASLDSNQFECVHGLCREHDARVFVVYVEPSEELTEAELLSFEEVVEATSLGRASGSAVFQLTIELADVVSEAFAPERFTAAQMEPTVVTPEGWYETKLFQHHEAFNGMRSRCEEFGIDVDLISIEQTTPASDDSTPYGLTERQHEALTLAISRGYYESPRAVSTAELAEAMDISQPSMSTLLRRGERQLLTTTLGAEPHLNTLSS